MKKGSYRTYFDITEVEHIPKEIKKASGKKKITDIYRIKAPNTSIFGYFCVGLLYRIDFMIKDKSSRAFENLENNDKIIFGYF